MKPARFNALLFSLLLFPAGMLAQDTGGTVQFWHAKQPVFDSDGGTKLSGDQFTAQLYAGPTEEELEPAGPAIAFGTGKYAGFIEFKANRVIAISNLGQGQEGFAQMRVWEAARGADYETARNNRGRHGVSNVIPITTGGDDLKPPRPPMETKGFVGFALVNPRQFIMVQPQPIMILIGQTGELSVVAKEGESVTYQWLKDGQELEGETGATLKITDMTKAKTGDYSVLAKRGDDEVLTKAVAVTTDFSLSLTGTKVIMIGDSGELKVELTPPGDAKVEWYRNGKPLAGQDGTSLIFPAVTNEDAGKYKALVTIGGLAKWTGQLTIKAKRLAKGGTVFFRNHMSAIGFAAPVFDADGKTPLTGTQFRAQLLAGKSENSLIPVSAAVPFGVEYRAGFFDPVATSTAIELPHIQPGAEAFFQVRVWEAAGGTFAEAYAKGGRVGLSNVFKVKTGNGGAPPALPTHLTGMESFSLSHPLLTEQPQGGWFRQGDELELRVGVIAPIGVVTYEWRKDDEPVEGANGPVLKFDSLSLSDSGWYTVRVRDEKRDVLTVPAQVKVWRRTTSGSIAFANRVQGRALFERVVNSAGEPLDGAKEGGSIVAQMFAGPVGGEPVAVGEPVAIGSGADAGFLAGDGVAVGVPGVAPGEKAAVQVRVWDSAKGNGLEEVFEAGGQFGLSDVAEIVAGGSAETPAPAALHDLGAIKVTRWSFGVVDAEGTVRDETTNVHRIGRYRPLALADANLVIARALFEGSAIETGMSLFSFNEVRFISGAIGRKLPVWNEARVAEVGLLPLGQAEPALIEGNSIGQVAFGQAGEYQLVARLKGVLLRGPKYELSVHAMPEGATVMFVNHRDDPVIFRDGTLLEGEAFRAQLFAGKDHEDLKPVSDALSFDRPGFWQVEEMNIVTIPDVEPGEKVFIQVRVWETAEGEPEFAQAVDEERQFGLSHTIQIVTGGAGEPRMPPASLDPLRRIMVRRPAPNFELVDGDDTMLPPDDGRGFDTIDFGDGSGFIPGTSPIGDNEDSDGAIARYGLPRGFLVRLELPEVVEGKVRIETSSDLKTWSSLGKTPADKEAIQFNDASASGEAIRFYRLTDSDGKVVSQNAPGYADVYLAPGVSMLTVPFLRGDNSIADLIPFAPEGSVVYHYDAATGAYTVNMYFWGEWDEPETVIMPGTAVFFRNDSGSNLLLSLRGNVPQGELTTPLGARWELVGSPIPQAGRADTDLGLPVADGDTLLRMPPGETRYQMHRFVGDQWLESAENELHGVPELGVGEGFWLLKAKPANWIREFSVD